MLIVVTGWPASGKSTVGRLLHHQLGLPLLDKDVILESLFDSLGSVDPDQRTRMSRASDDILLRLAATMEDGILVNWWHRDILDKLISQSDGLVEVFCECPVAVATARFQARRRHPGHHDPALSPAEVGDRINALVDQWTLPFEVGPVVRVDTSGALDESGVVARVRSVCQDAHRR